MRTFVLRKEALMPTTGIMMQPGTRVVLADDTADHIVAKFTGFPEFWQEDKPPPPKVGVRGRAQEDGGT